MIKRFFVSAAHGAVRKCKVIFSNRKAVLGGVIMLFFILLAVFGPMLFPYNPVTDENHKYLAPSAEHFLGTDNLGRDVFRQLVHGSRDVLTIALLTSVITIILGTVLGMVSGLAGGVTDRVIGVVTNLFLSIPSFPVQIGRAHV